MTLEERNNALNCAKAVIAIRTIIAPYMDTMTNREELVSVWRQTSLSLFSAYRIVRDLEGGNLEL